MNKDCEKYSAFIEDLVEGEGLDRQAAAQTEAHVFDCAGCRNEYELLRQEKEILAHYMFDFEPPTDSWTNFQSRLVEQEPTSSSIVPVNEPRRKRRIFAFGFSPAFAAAGLLLFLGVGFVLLKNSPFGEDDDKYVSETKTEVSPPPANKIDSQSAANLSAKSNVAASDDARKNKELSGQNQSSKSDADFRFGKKSIAVERLKIRQETPSSGVKRKRESETAVKDEALTATLLKQNLETKIAAQIEKIELLLRSFRNAQATENATSFDVEYEKRQARKLLETNVALRRDAETYGIAYAEELLSRVDSYLLEIANLGDKPAPEKVLDIKERVSNQNIIANLQIYSSVVAMK